MGSHNTNKTPDGPSTGRGALVNNTPAARDEVETKLELTGKAISVKIVIADDALILGFMDLNEDKKYKPFTTPTKVPFVPTFDPHD